MQAAEAPRAGDTRPALTPAHIPPLLPIAVGICLGIAADDAWCPPAWFWLLGAAPAAAMFAQRARRIAALGLIVLAAAAVGGLAHLVEVRRVAPDHIVHHTALEPVLARLSGTIVNEPNIIVSDDGPFAEWSHSTGRTVFLCRVESVDGSQGRRAASGLVRVTVREPALRLRMGDRVELFGRLYRPPPPRNPAEFDWARWNLRNGIRAAVSCPNSLCVRRLDSDSLSALVAWWGALRARARAMLLDDMSSGGAGEASLLEAIILGQRQSTDRALNEAFVRTGCAHYLAASGLNVGILAVFIWWIGRLLRRTRRECAAWAIVATVVYVLIADPRPPILRAGIMTVCVGASMWARRPPNALNAVVLSAVVILLLQPAALFDAGFQLSYAAVPSVIVLAPAFASFIQRRIFREPTPEDAALFKYLHPSSRERVVKGFRTVCVYGFASSLAASLGVLPISLYHFHLCSLWGALNSAVLSPLVFLVTLLGYAKLLVTLALPTFGHLLAAPLDGLTALLAALVRALAAIPHASVVFPAPPRLLIAAYGSVLIAVGLCHHGLCRRRSVAWAGLVAAVLAAVWLWPRNEHDRLTVTALAVGRAGATVICMPDGHTVVFDCGGSEGSDVGKNLVAPYALSRGRRRVDAILISHAHLDHFNGVPSLLDSLDCGPVLVDRHFARRAQSDGGPSGRLRDELRARGRLFETLSGRGTPPSYGAVRLEVLWPPDDPPFELSENDSSLVVRLRYAGRSILFTGDIAERAELWLIEHAELSADVLFAPHHGASVSSTRAFIEAVNPRWVIRSAAQRTADTRSGFNADIGARTLLNTADVGAVTVEIDRAGIRVHGFRE